MAAKEPAGDKLGTDGKVPDGKDKEDKAKPDKVKEAKAKEEVLLTRISITQKLPKLLKSVHNFYRGHFQISFLL